MSRKIVLANLGMILVTMIWGITFVMVKDALNDAPPFIFLALRKGLAFVAGVIYLNKNIKKITTLEIIGGLACALVLYAGYSFQNFGLILTTPSKSAFITSVSVILVPVLLLLLGLQKVALKIWLIIGAALIGLYILLNPMGGEGNFGDILTLGCALSFAIHIIFQDIYLKKKVDVVRFFVIQVMFVFLISAVSGFAFESSNIILSERLFVAIAVTGILGTFVAIIIMLWAQTILSATQTAILLSLEPVFAALFSVFYAGEILGLSGWIGGAIIVVSVASSGFFSSDSKNKSLKNKIDY